MAGVEWLQMKKAANAALFWNRRAKFRLGVLPFRWATSKGLPTDDG